MTAKVRLEADRAELAAFIDATFRYADEGTHAVLRTFAEGSDEVLGTVRVPLNGAGLDPLVDNATRQATRAANARRAAVFAPPISTFLGTRTREQDLGNGLVLSVEADHAPAVARRNLEYLLGPATVIVASGGQWIDPETGVVEDKLHLHWRCREPSDPRLSIGRSSVPALSPAASSAPMLQRYRSSILCAGLAAGIARTNRGSPASSL